MSIDSISNAVLQQPQPAAAGTQRFDRARLAPLQGASNVRDLGGYPTLDGRCTRHGVLLRADSLHALTSSDQAWLRSYGVGTVIDLRLDGELQRAPSVYARAPFVTYHHIPICEDDTAGSDSRYIAPPPQTLGAYYRFVVDCCQASLRTVFDAITTPQSPPALFGCTAGKDRTGIVAALVLSAAGVPRQLVIEDYALTAIHGASLLQRLRAEGAAHAESMGLSSAWFERMLRCEPAYMADLLAYLDQRHGGPTAYLHTIGVREEQLVRLRANLVAHT